MTLRLIGMALREKGVPQKLPQPSTPSDREGAEAMRRLIHPFKDNSLSIVLFALFTICISAQPVAGWRLQNETLAPHGQALVGYWHNLSTGTFMEGLATNWRGV